MKRTHCQRKKLSKIMKEKWRNGFKGNGKDKRVVPWKYCPYCGEIIREVNHD